MNILLGIIGAIAGIATGIACGFTMTYSKVYSKNTFGGGVNPELPPPPPPGLASALMPTIIGFFFFMVGLFVLNFAISNYGKTAEELTRAAGPNTQISMDAAGLIVFGAFAVFIGGLTLYAGIQEFMNRRNGSV
ncbi:MAG: hypothetical protein MJ094_09345 [Saccharofermentans sp.]|nr:hypothetical protein [Saccharofermentans sp.]